MWTLLVFSGVEITDNRFQSAGIFKNEYWFRVVSVPDIHKTSWLDQKQTHGGYCMCTRTLEIKVTECVQPTGDYFIIVSYFYCTALSRVQHWECCTIVDIQSFRSEHIYWCDFAELIYWRNGSIMNTNCSAYVQEHIYWSNSTVSCKTSFDFFVTSPTRGNIHQQDCFIFLEFQVFHRDLQSTLLKGFHMKYSSRSHGRRTGP